MHHEPWRADRMLTQLAELLRTMLRALAVATHSLREELVVINQYLELMSIRFGERLTVSRTIDDDLLDIRVPWLVLQFIVENALEHGIWPRSQPGTLRIAPARAVPRRSKSSNACVTVEGVAAGS